MYSSHYTIYGKNEERVVQQNDYAFIIGIKNIMKVGIVGLPNVGKSTLFNALTKQAAAARNVPFTTIEPNIGVVPVPDERLNILADMSKSETTVPTTIEFVDIAGLVKNAHAGEGLGNTFLSHIREVDAIIHVVRFFEEKEVIHVHTKVDPVEDASIINTELALADLATIERIIESADKKARGNDKDAIAQLPVLNTIARLLEEGKPARIAKLSEKESGTIQHIPLLTQKPVLYLANVSESQIPHAQEITSNFARTFSEPLSLSVKIEQELVELPEEERAAFLSEYGLKQTGLERLIQRGYALLNLITFFTTGPKETRAWTVTNGSTAPQAAGKIHSDMEQGFIRAETISYEDFVDAGSYTAARAAGKARDEGKEYVVQDGDVFLFKFST